MTLFSLTPGLTHWPQLPCKRHVSVEGMLISIFCCLDTCFMLSIYLYCYRQLEKTWPSDGWILFDHNGCLTFKSLLTTMPVSVINVCSTTRLKHRWSLTAWLRRQNWRRPPETDLKAWFGCYLLTLQCLPRCAFQCTGKYILTSIISLQRWHAEVVPICQSYFQEVMLKDCLTDIGWRRSFSSTQGCRQTLNRCSRWNLSKLLKILYLK